jgi:hypothetical protein
LTAKGPEDPFQPFAPERTQLLMPLCAQRKGKKKTNTFANDSFGRGAHDPMEMLEGTSTWQIPHV